MNFRKKLECLSLASLSSQVKCLLVTQLTSLYKQVQIHCFYLEYTFILFNKTSCLNEKAHHNQPAPLARVLEALPG